MILDFVSSSRAVSPPDAVVDAGNSALTHSKSKAVSPLASRADASYFLAPQEVTKKRCRATPPALRLLAQPPARFPARFGRAGVRRTRFVRFALCAQTCGGPFSGPPCNARRRRRRAADTERSEAFSLTCTQRSAATHLPRWRRVSQQRTGKSGSACLSDRRERVRNRPFDARNAGHPAQFAGRLRGMSGFAYFCRTKSRSHQPAKLAAKPPLNFRRTLSPTIGGIRLK